MVKLYRIQQLQKLYNNNSLHHAIMLVGNCVYELSVNFAKYLLCKVRSNLLNCNCVSCNLFGVNNHPDCFFIDLGADQEIKIDIIRDVNIFVYTGSYLAGRKIILINNFHNINNQAANALLKTLEEPPIDREIVFLLSTDRPNMLLKTVLSRVLRCNIFDNEYHDFKECQIEIIKDLYNIWVKNMPNVVSLIDKWQAISKTELIYCLWSIMSKIIIAPLEISGRQSTIDLNSTNNVKILEQILSIKKQISLHTQWELLDSLNYINKIITLGYQINWQLFLYNFIISKYNKRNIYAEGTRL